MADLTNSSWSEADSSNIQPSPSGFPSGILPSQVGGTVRALMGATKRSFDRSNVMTTSTGSANAYVLTYAQAPEGYVTGEIYRFFANFTNTAAPTLNINGLGTRPILRADGTAMAANEIISGQVVSVVVSGSNFLHQPVGTRFFTDTVSAPALTLSGTLTLAGTGTNAFQAGNGDAASYATHNVRMLLWNGLGLSTYDGSINGFYDARAGRWDTKAAPRVNGSDVWYPGNFNPATKADLNAVVNFAGVGLNGGGSNTYVYTDSGANNFVVRTGAPNAYRYSSIDPAGNFTAAAGGIFNGELSTSGRLIVGRGQPASQIVMTDSDEGDRSLHNNSGLIGFLGKGGDWIFRVGDDGAVWTKQFGDLNSRIESRASDFATARANERVAKTGDRMTGDLLIDKAYPTFNMNYPNVRNVGWQLRENANTYLFDFTAGRATHGFGLDGTIYTVQMGDMATYITNSANNAANARISRYGDTMTGPLYLDYGYPQLQLTNRDGNGFGYIDFLHVPYGHTDYTWRIQHDNGNNSWSVNYVDNGRRFQVFTDGSVWTAQLGDLNGRIESRAAAYADDRRNDCINRINNKSARLAYVGDLNCGNYGTGMAEPWGGGVITGLQSNNGSGYATGGRGRQLQMSDSNGNWYACGYV